MSDSKKPELDRQLVAASVKMISSDELFQGARALRIAHEGHFYILRITKENKLILTK